MYPRGGEVTDQQIREAKEYGESLCLNQHGGEIPGRLILKLCVALSEANETIAVLRTPPVGTGGVE